MIKIFKLDLDASKFNQKLADAAKSIDKIGTGGAITQATENFKGLGSVVSQLGMLKLSVDILKCYANLTLAAEQAERMRNSLKLLGDSAGVATGALVQGLKEAADGLIDDDDLIKIANKSIVALGKNAERLPEILTLARKASVAFGGDATENFERISTAIETGNMKGLKNIGINIDAEKVYRNFAQSIGVTVDRLTEQGKQQAILNAVLAKGQERMGAIDENAVGLAGSWSRLVITVKDLGKTFGEALYNVYGKPVEWLIDKLSSGLKLVDQYYKKLSGSYEIEYAVPRKPKGATDKESAQKEGLVAGVDVEKQKKTQAQFYEDLNQMQIAANQKQIENAETIIQWQNAKDEERKLKEEEYFAKKAELNQQFHNNDLLTKEQKDQMMLALEETHKQQMISLESNYNEQRKKFIDDLEQKNYRAQNSFAAGWSNAAKQAGKDFGNFSVMGQQAFTAVHRRSAEAFIALGDGSKDAGEAMKGFLFGSLADIAEAQGMIMLAQGIAGNFAAGAAGAGLLILAGILRSQAKSASQSFSGGGGGSGGGFDSFDSRQDSGNEKPEMQAQQKKSVTLQVMGNYMETEETKMHLMDLIRQATDATDFKYQQIGVS